MDEIRIAPSLSSSPQLEPPEGSSPPERGEGFARLIAGVLEEASRDLNEGEHQARELAAGRGGMVETVLALNKADLSMRFVVELRNKFLEMYQAIKRING